MVINTKYKMGCAIRAKSVKTMPEMTPHTPSYSKSYPRLKVTQLNIENQLLPIRLITIKEENSLLESSPGKFS